MLPSLTNDQFVLGLCLVSVTVSGLIMYFSYYLGRFTGAIREPAPVRPQLGLHRPDEIAATKVASSHEKAA